MCIDAALSRLAGKALLDERLLPLPLSHHFLKVVLGGTVAIDDIRDIFLEPGRYEYISIFCSFECIYPMHSCALHIYVASYLYACFTMQRIEFKDDDFNYVADMYIAVLDTCVIGCLKRINMKH
jgi:hypothetical protein